MIIAGTGHRPTKIGGYNERSHVIARDVAMDWLREQSPELVISGMALGWDQALAEAAVFLDIPFHAYVPFAGQESRWPDESVIRFGYLLNKAAEVVYVSEGGYAAWKMQVRNEAMVNACDMVLALWDGSKGGTGNCIAYAKKVGKPITNLWRAYCLKQME